MRVLESHVSKETDQDQDQDQDKRAEKFLYIEMTVIVIVMKIIVIVAVTVMMIAIEEEIKEEYNKTNIKKNNTNGNKVIKAKMIVIVIARSNKPNSKKNRVSIQVN